MVISQRVPFTTYKTQSERRSLLLKSLAFLLFGARVAITWRVALESRDGWRGEWRRPDKQLVRLLLLLPAAGVSHSGIWIDLWLSFLFVSIYHNMSSYFLVYSLVLQEHKFQWFFQKGAWELNVLSPFIPRTSSVISCGDGTLSSLSVGTGHTRKTAASC